MEALLSLWHTLRLPLALASFVLVAGIQLRTYYNHRAARAITPEVTVVEEKKKQDSATSTLPNRLEDTQTESKEISSHILPTQVNPLKRKLKTAPRRIVGRRATSPKQQQNVIEQVQPLVFFSSLSGTTEKAATELVASLTTSLQTPIKNILPARLLDLSDIDYDNYYTSLPKPETDSPTPRYFYFILVPTYNIDTYLDNFLEHLRETHHDFRIDTAPLQQILGYAVFGFGDTTSWPTEEQGFCSQAIEVDRWMARLTAKKRAYPVGMGDVSKDAKERLEDWKAGVQEVVLDLASGKALGEGAPGSGDAVESDEEDVDELSAEDKKKKQNSDMTDMEALGSLIDKPSSTSPDTLIPVDFTTYTSSSTPSFPTPTPKAMVPTNSPTYTALTKQGYTIIGSHSGVKLCRWTKSALRGRGSCYKYSFYGIQSHLCMETTPSLSCSNKCVFCWRHGTNPVGTTWRWQVDPPDLIFAGAKEGHYKKIKMMRGVPGVRAERFEEAMRIRHCALSLVGEPIFYPHINEFTAMLHNERISTFLVCNAQHPDQLQTLQKVTQLYVSIDASNAESLRRIDRPLHRDFWERFTRCLDIIREKRFEQRTVFRLTLVKGFNIEDEAEDYADLVERALPCFVEVKGVTYCGTSSASGAGLTMQNVPFYEEVCAFVEALDRALERRGLEYGIAAEHAHSCCILLASKRFYKTPVTTSEEAATGEIVAQKKWHTQIDYAAFFRLLESGKPFRAEDYCAETPDWSVWGAGGFDPRDVRVKKKGKQGDVKGIGELESERRAAEREGQAVVENQVEEASLQVAVDAHGDGHGEDVVRTTG